MDKGLIGLAKWSFGAGLLAVLFVFLVSLSVPVESKDFAPTIVTDSANISTPQTNKFLNITVQNRNITNCITEVNITLPSGFAFVTDSNITMAFANFSNWTFGGLGRLMWTNLTSTCIIGNISSNITDFLFNVSIPLTFGNKVLQVDALYNDISTNQTNRTLRTYTNFRINTYDTTQCLGNPCPAVNKTADTDMFYYHGATAHLVANVTTPTGTGIPGLNVSANLAGIGGNAYVEATNLGDGLYTWTQAVSYANLAFTSPVENVNLPMNISDPYDLKHYYDSNLNANVLLVNVTDLGCPPAGQGSFPLAPDSTGTLRQPTGCTTNATRCAAFHNGSSMYPVVVNTTGTGYDICAPTFGPLTSNMSVLALNQNMEAITNFRIDIPSKGGMTFLTAINFSSETVMESIMQFAMKSVMSAGMMGMNDSEWNGSSTRPNLNVTARLSIYNVNTLLGITDPSLGVGTYNGAAPPSLISVCPAARCKGILWDGQNLTFTVTSFSTYVTGGTLHNLTYTNGTTMSRTVVKNYNASYLVNARHDGNASTENYYFVANGTGTRHLNVTGGADNVTEINQSQTRTFELNVTSNTAGTYTTWLEAFHYSNGTEYAWNLSSPEDGVTFTTTVVEPQITFVYPSANNSNVSAGSGLAVRFSTNTVLDSCAYEVNSTENVTFNCGNVTWASTNFTQGTGVTLRVWANDTMGNGGSGRTLVESLQGITVDNAAPNAATIVTPSNSSNFSSSKSITLNITCSDALSRVAYAEYNLTNSTSEVITQGNLTIGNRSLNEAQATITVGSYANANLTLSVMVTDNAGNTNRTTNINITVDNTRPGVRRVTPGTGDVKAADFVVNVSLVKSATEIDTIYINVSNSTKDVLNYSTFIKSAALTDARMTFDITGLTEGDTHTAQIVANSTSNMTNSSVSFTFTVDTAGPGITSWNYSIVTRQLFLKFNETMFPSSFDASKFNITDSDGSTMAGKCLNTINDTGLTVLDTTSNSSVIVVNFTYAQNAVMKYLNELPGSQGKLTMAAGAVKDLGGTNVLARSGLVRSVYDDYNLTQLLSGVWDDLWLPATAVLQGIASLGGNYSVDKVLSSITANLSLVYYYNGTAWSSYNGTRAVNSLTEMNLTNDQPYWVKKTSSNTLTFAVV